MLLGLDKSCNMLMINVVVWLFCGSMLNDLTLLCVNGFDLFITRTSTWKAYWRWNAYWLQMFMVIFRFNWNYFSWWHFNMVYHCTKLLCIWFPFKDQDGCNMNLSKFKASLWCSTFTLPTIVKVPQNQCNIQPCRLPYFNSFVFLETWVSFQLLDVITYV
jgi:hypothetical protein